MRTSYGAYRVVRVLTPSFPPRRSSGLLLFALVVAPWSVGVAGMFIGGDPLANPHRQLAKSSAHFLFCGLSSIIFDPDRPAGAGACLYRPGQRAERIADRARPPFV